MKIHSQNKKARFNFSIEDEIEVGISLLGWEVKSIKAGAVSIKEGFVKVHKNEVFLTGMHVTKWKFLGDKDFDEARDRKLLLSRKEIDRLELKRKRSGYAIIPLKVYTNKRGIIKVTLGIGKGKKKYDKRAKLKEQAQKNDIDRDLKGETKY